MSIAPRLRKAILTTHVVSSVGWLGAVVAYAALDVSAVVGRDIGSVRAAYLAMEVTVMYAIVPLALASLTIGIINAVATPWGLFRHYWVLIKLALTAVATAVLLIETQTVQSLAGMAQAAADPRRLPGTLPHSLGGLAVLLLLTILSIYKPAGLTRYGWRKQQQQRRSQRDGSSAVA